MNVKIVHKMTFKYQQNLNAHSFNLNQKTIGGESSMMAGFP